ncbi:MAG: hypothetical protein IIU00_07850 [Clostridia bacterium]|nr:hypothetical protein [Clostridia bacterium]
MLNKKGKKSEEKAAMFADEIRELRELERLDSVYTEQSRSVRTHDMLIISLITMALGALILTGLYFAEKYLGNLRNTALFYLWMIDDSAGFMTDTVTAVIHLLLFTLIAVCFGFALDINFSRSGRPKEVWGKNIRFILLASFGSCVLYAGGHYLLTGSSFALTGSILSKSLYYFFMLTVVPTANVLLYLVLPSAIIRMILVLVSDTKEKTELPLIFAGTAIMTLGLLGIIPRSIENFGWIIFLFTLIQSAACSVLYHRTDTIWPVVLMYSGVSATYYILAALLHLL